MATALTILPLSLACAAGSSEGGSRILNGQVNFNATVSTLNTQTYSVNGDVAGQSVAGGNAVDITTMNDTHVVSTQYNKSMTIDSTINAGVGNVGGSVGYSSQAVCNSAGVSTDPNVTAIKSTQECHSVDPSSQINANIANIGGDVGLASHALGNSFEADSNANNMPVQTKQINTSFVHSTINANVSKVGGSVSSSSAAIGNNAQILHYTTGG
jgi:hypothetical protein